MATASLPKLLREDNRRAQVEGETFSSNPAHPFWRVKVRFTTGLKPSTERIRAASGDQALDFVCARYPFADRRRCEVLGRWDAESAPIDHKAPVERSAPAPPMRQLVPTHTSKPPPPLSPTPASKPATMTKPVLGADLKHLPRDPQGRATIDESALSKAIAANDGGLSWPVIADMLGCNERNLRERAGKWKRSQKARQDAAEALAFATGKRQQAGPVPEGVPVGGVDPSKEVLVSTKAPTVTASVAGAMAELEEAAMTKERERLKRLALQEMRSPNQGRDWGPVADPTDTQLWDVLGPQGRPLASRQSSDLSCRLMTVLGAAGVECSRVASLGQPTPAPVINPTKAGGFTVQITVNPIESGG